MAEKHVVSALVERRARLAGELRTTEGEVRRIKRELASLDLCIRLFKEDYQPEIIAPKLTFAKKPPPACPRVPGAGKHSTSSAKQDWR